VSFSRTLRTVFENGQHRVLCVRWKLAKRLPVLTAGAPHEGVEATDEVLFDVAHARVGQCVVDVAGNAEVGSAGVLIAWKQSLAGRSQRVIFLIRESDMGGGERDAWLLGFLRGRGFARAGTEQNHAAAEETHTLNERAA
jgi:hypothetical protein